MLLKIAGLSSDLTQCREKFYFTLIAALFAFSAAECSKQTEYRDIDQGDEEIETLFDSIDEAEVELDNETELTLEEKDEIDSPDEESAPENEEKDENADLKEEKPEPEIADELDDHAGEEFDAEDGEGTDELDDLKEETADAPDEDAEDEQIEEADAQDERDDVEGLDEAFDEEICFDCAVECQSGADCRGLSFVCIEGRCAHCVSDAQCQDEIEGGYEARAKCFNGICVSDWCETGFDCPEEKPACREGFCAGCLDDLECGFGKCLVEQGLCYYGECYSANASCGSYAEKICGEDLVCRRCKNDAECVDSIAHEKAICEYGSCSIGCTDAPSCAPGWVCNHIRRCVPCVSNEECVLQYGQNYKCGGGVCAE